MFSQFNSPPPLCFVYIASSSSRMLQLTCSNHDGMSGVALKNSKKAALVTV
jgi:hypothetical protein